MKINLAKIISSYENLKYNAGDEHYTVELVYGCFKNLGVSDTSICERCSNYQFGCYSYLKAAEEHNDIK